MKKLKVLQTPIRFFPYIGGVENHVYYLAKELVKRGHTIKVLCANEPKSQNKKIDGITVKRLPYSFKITNTNISLSLPKEISTSSFDIVHTHMPTPWTSDWSILLAKLMKKKSIITIHNDMDKSSFVSKLITKIYLYSVFQISLALVDKIIIVNPDWQNSFTATKQLLSKHKAKITVLPNGIDLTLFESNATMRRSENMILFVSILDKHHKFKGLEYLLQAVVELKKTSPKIVLTVIGEGELKETYKAMAEKLGIGKNVSFIGGLSQKELAAYYRKASVFVLPSIEIEGFGIVLLEAMACKAPIVATDIVGVATDIKKYKTGIIVKPRDAQALARSITKILTDKKLARIMGINGRKLIEQKYDWKLIAQNVEKVYKEVL